MNKDTQLIWESYQNKLIVDHFDVMIERADRYVSGLLERISPEDIQRMKDADATGNERDRKNLMRDLQKKYHPDKGGDDEDSKIVNNWYQDHNVPHSDTQPGNQHKSQSNSGSASQSSSNHAQYQHYKSSEGTYGSAKSPYEYTSNGDIDPEVVDVYNDLMNQWNNYDVNHRYFHDPLGKYVATSKFKEYTKQAAEWWHDNLQNIPSGRAGIEYVLSNIMKPDQWLIEYEKTRGNVPPPGSFKQASEPEPEPEPEPEQASAADSQQYKNIIQVMTVINQLISDDVLKGAEQYKRGEFDPRMIEIDIERLSTLRDKLSEMLQFLTANDEENNKKTSNTRSKIDSLLQRINKMFGKQNV